MWFASRFSSCRFPIRSLEILIFFGFIALDTTSFILSKSPLFRWTQVKIWWMNYGGWKEIASPAYSMSAPNTKRTQTMTQASTAVRPSAFGMLLEWQENIVFLFYTPAIFFPTKFWLSIGKAIDKFQQFFLAHCEKNNPFFVSLV